MKIQISVSRILSAALTSLLLGCACLSVSAQQTNPNNLPPCPESTRESNSTIENYSKWNNCFGKRGIVLHASPTTFHTDFGRSAIYEGNYLRGVPNGWGEIKFFNGNSYVGEFRDGYYHGQGIRITADGRRFEGIWEDSNFIREAKVNLPNINNNIANNTNRNDIKHEYEKKSQYQDIKTVKSLSLVTNPNNRLPCPYLADDNFDWKLDDCWGDIHWKNGDRYTGEIVKGKRHGWGTTLWTNGDQYVGQHEIGFLGGWSVALKGIFIKADGSYQEGFFYRGQFIKYATVSLPSKKDNVANSIDSNDGKTLTLERQQLAEERRRPEQEKREHEQQRQSQRVNLQVTHTQPAADGSITINVQTGADTASLLINGEEQGGRTSGDYIIKKVARAGQETKFTVIATDINGNKDTKIITVTRQVVESAVKYAQLNPAQVKKQPERDAVAVIIGIAKYESLPVAEFANDDARAFYDYAIRGLGVKPENIKLLVDEGAREAEILKTFRTWLPSRVKSSTEVFVFYSGHGLPTPDGSGLYLLPLHADRDVIDDTAIPFAKINDAISMAKPKSVTVILDACYSGQTKAGQTLVASARPLTLKAQNSFFPPNFTVISASQSDQISSSSPDLQHGIFSYYLMKGMEGDADMNKDGKITLGEMRDYLVEQVGRQAAMMSRKQEPQLIGDSGRVLVGR